MQQNTSINIGSKYFIDRVENDIVQLARTLSIEHGVSIEDAKYMARKILQLRINQLLTKEELEGITEIKNNVVRSLKHGMSSLDNPKVIYELLKTFELL